MRLGAFATSISSSGNMTITHYDDNTLVKHLEGGFSLPMDNCVEENKNKYVYGFLSCLVEKHIFAEVRISYIAT